MIYKTLHTQKVTIEQHWKPRKNSGALERISSSCGILCFALLTTPVMRHEWMTKEYILNVITMLSKICISNYEYLVLHNICEEFEHTKGMNAKPSWALSYGRWIYNCLCIQCTSLLKLWVRISVMAKCTRCNSRWYSLSVTCHTSMFFTVYFDFLH